jgi:hypothetical protein
MTDRPKEYTVSDKLMNRIYNTLMGYANQSTYEAPRTGGVLAGCPRGPKPTPENLTMAARWLLREIDRDLLGRKESEHWPSYPRERNEFEATLAKLNDALDGWTVCVECGWLQKPPDEVRALAVESQCPHDSTSVDANGVWGCHDCGLTRDTIS